MTTAVEDPDLCCICGQNPATTFGICLRCIPKATWLTDPPWSD